jgi:hypothetical protein
VTVDDPATGVRIAAVSLQPTVLHVRDGELAEAGSWVYLWLRPGSERRVVFVGGTGLPPAVRVWLHLHDPDPEVGRMAAGYPAAGGDLREPLDIVAFPVPEGVERRAVRDALIRRLAAAGELSPLYCGFAPVADDGDAAAAAVVEAALAHLALHDG